MAVAAESVGDASGAFRPAHALVTSNAESASAQSASAEGLSAIDDTHMVKVGDDGERPADVGVRHRVVIEVEADIGRLARAPCQDLVAVERVLGQSQQVMEQAGWSEDLLEEWNDLIDAVRTTGDLLGPEDVFELESGTALAEFGQRVALRQVLQATALLEQGLPRQKPRGTPRRYSVATNIMDEDSYPVGGFTSISNRGTIESLLRSELAYMDDDDNRPDMFDIKYVRDELLYYARDENQFLRRRLSYFFLLHPELVKSRFKDSDCSWQRIIYVLALLVLAVRKLTDWLSDDAIHFELLFLRGQPGSAGLDDERSLLRTLLAEELSKGLVAIDEVGDEDVRSRLTFHARQSLCHVLSIGADKPLPSDLPVSSHLDLSESAPKLRLEEHLSDPGADHTGDDAWQRCAEVLMKFWI